MPVKRTLKELERLANEVRQLCSEHDGIHNLHGALANLDGWVRFAKEAGLKVVDWDNVDLMVTRSRIAAQTGFWPKS